MGLDSPYNTTENGTNLRRDGADAGGGQIRPTSVLSHQYVYQLGTGNKRSVTERSLLAVEPGVRAATAWADAALAPRS